MAQMDPMQIMSSALSTMGFLAEKADERDFLKRVSVEMTCQCLKDTEERIYKSGAKAGQLRGHQTNLTTENGDILQDILLDHPLEKGETAIVSVELLIPESFLSGKVRISGNGELAKEIAANKGAKAPRPTEPPSSPVGASVPSPMTMGGGKNA